MNYHLLLIDKFHQSSLPVSDKQVNIKLSFIILLFKLDD